jgi:hypothetical protein
MKTLRFRSPNEYLYLDEGAPESSATDDDVVTLSTAVDLYKDRDGNVVTRIDKLPREEQRRIQLAWKHRFEALPLEEEFVRSGG